MIKPILACKNPYYAAEKFHSAGWNIDFTQPVESGDPMVGISLFDHQFLLGITEGYVSSEAVSHIGCGVVFYVTVPKTEIENVYQKHKAFVTSKLQMQSWGDLAFEAQIDSFKFMFATS